MEPTAAASGVNPLYVELFVETFGGATALPFGTDLIYFAMMLFGGYNMILATFIAVMGASLGMGVNLAIGYAFSRMQKNGKSKVNDEIYEKWQRRAIMITPIIGLLSSIHLVGACVAALGFLRVPAQKVVMWLVIGQGIYYGYYLSQVSG